MTTKNFGDIRLSDHPLVAPLIEVARQVVRMHRWEDSTDYRALTASARDALAKIEAAEAEAPADEDRPEPLLDRPYNDAKLRPQAAKAESGDGERNSTELRIYPTETARRVGELTEKIEAQARVVDLQERRTDAPLKRVEDVDERLADLAQKVEALSAKPAAPVALVEAEDEPYCEAVGRLPEGFQCTLRPGHAGEHAAGDGTGQFFERWTDEPAAPPPPDLDADLAWLREHGCFLHWEFYRQGRRLAHGEWSLPPSAAVADLRRKVEAEDAAKRGAS